MERHRVGLAAHVARDHRHGAELADGARREQDDAVEQAPADVRQRHAAEHLPAAGAERDGRFFRFGALLLEHRDQLARDERHRDEERRQDDAGDGEDDLDVALREPRPEVALAAEEQHEDQARDDGGDREGQLEERDQHSAAGELEAGERPRGGDAEGEVQRHDDQRRHEREADGVPRLGLGDRAAVGVGAVGEGLREDRGERDEEEHREEEQRDQPRAPPSRRARGRSCRHRPGGAPTPAAG